MLKKFISFILCIVLASAFVPAAFAEETITVYYSKDDARYVMPLNSGDVSLFEENSDILTAAAQLREAMVKRESRAVIKLPYRSDDARGDFQRIIDLAMAHTSVPNEGDYLRMTYYRADGNITTGYASTSFEYIISYYTTAAQEKDVDNAVDALMFSLDIESMTSDYDKICAIYNWICENIEYDYDNLDDDSYVLKYSAYSALINRTAVCQGYASLLYRLLLECGIDCRVIAGTAGGPHAWNIIKIGDKYYNADSTWDAGRVGSYKYFLKGAESFTDHVSDAEYLTDEFSAVYPISQYDYWGNLPSGTIGTDISWSIDEAGTLTIKGSGVIPDYDSPSGSGSDTSPFCGKDFTNNIKKIVISGNITRIGDFAFYWLFGLKDVEVSENVQSIGYAAFWDCYSLESATLPKSLTKIEKGAFGYCENLRDIYYAGSENDWSRITIEDTNEALYSATLHYGYTAEPEIKSVELYLIGGAAIVFAEAENVPDDAVFAAAGYDVEGNFLGFGYVTDGSVILDERTAKAKVFIFDGLESLKPLCVFGEAVLN